jgi:uncharacterized membrane protein
LKIGKVVLNNTFIKEIRKNEMSAHISVNLISFFITWVLKVITPSIRNRVLAFLKRKTSKYVLFRNYNENSL